jgi:hypothetical protein
MLAKVYGKNGEAITVTDDHGELVIEIASGRKVDAALHPGEAFSLSELLGVFAKRQVEMASDPTMPPATSPRGYIPR